MKKKIYLACISALMCTFMTSCGDSTPSKYQKQGDVYVNPQAKAVVMITGNHSCAMQMPEDVFNKLEKDMEDVVYGGYFAMVNADSTPTKVTLKDEKFFDDDRKNENAIADQITKRTAKLKTAIKTAAETAPDSAETDLLQAIREAKSILMECETAKKEIIIVDTGISTAGDLNLCMINFDEDTSARRTASSIVDEYLLNFEGRNVLPDLSGIDVVFYGEHGYMAPSSSPQSDNMKTTDAQYIKELWETIVTQCGASSVSFTEIAGWDTPIIENEEIPHVSTVLFKRPIQKIAPGGIEGEPENPPDINLSIYDSSIGFYPNQATFVSLDNFTAQYNSVAMDIQIYLNHNENKPIYIAGAVAKYGNDNGYQLSHDRAEAIKKLLTDGSFKDTNGNNIYIDKDRIVTIGLGDKFPDKVDEYVNGEFTENLAAQNRKVIIFNEFADGSNDNYYIRLQKAFENGELNPETVAEVKNIFK